MVRLGWSTNSPPSASQNNPHLGSSEPQAWSEPLRCPQPAVVMRAGCAALGRPLDAVARQLTTRSTRAMSTSPSSWRWKKLPSVHPPRHDHGVTFDGSGLTIYGGNFGFGVASTWDSWRLEPGGKSWIGPLKYNGLQWLRHQFGPWLASTSAMHRPLTHRAPCSTRRPCGWKADWCLQSNVAIVDQF